MHMGHVIVHGEDIFEVFLIWEDVNHPGEQLRGEFTARDIAASFDLIEPNRPNVGRPGTREAQDSQQHHLNKQFHANAYSRRDSGDVGPKPVTLTSIRNRGEFRWQKFRYKDGESLESALNRFKRKPSAGLVQATNEASITTVVGGQPR
jgi:hypothetical protein